MHSDIVTVTKDGQDYYSLQNIAKTFETSFHHFHRSLLTMLKKPDLEAYNSDIIVIYDTFRSRTKRGRPSKDVLVPIELGNLLIARRKTTRRVRESQNCYVICFDNGIKIGCTNDLVTRLKAYENPWCRPIIASFEYDSKYSYELESFLKHHFFEYTKRGVKEFFYDVTLEMIRKAADDFLQSKKAQIKVN